MSDKAEYWVKTAEYDMETAYAMLKTGRLLYVGFLCHLVIEKMLKACYANAGLGIPPKIHNLRRLAALTGIDDDMNEVQKDYLDRLDPLHIEGRYPGYKDDLASTLNEVICRSLIEQTEELRQWIKQQLSIT